MNITNQPVTLFGKQFTLHRQSREGTDEFNKQTLVCTVVNAAVKRNNLYSLTIEIRFDDECRNKHNSLAITAYGKGPGDYEIGGCCHGTIAEVMPELKPFIKWHLCSTDAPMHYVANTMYHASDRDHWGLLKGQPKYNNVFGVKFGNSPFVHKLSKPLYEFIVRKILETSPDRRPFTWKAVPHVNQPGQTYKFGDKFTYTELDHKWHECPFDTHEDAQMFCDLLNGHDPQIVVVPEITMYGEGKLRDLDAARSCAVWPDATDEDLLAPGLKERLEARLPQLQADFRADIESLGLKWSAKE